MIQHFTGDTADEIWSSAAAAILDPTIGHQQNSRAGRTRELLHCTLHLRDPRQRWILSRRPALNPAFAIAEVIWILQGRDDAAFINYWNPILPRFAGSSENYHGAYGYRLRKNLGFDQLERIYQVLRHNPDSRQAVLQIWDGRIDMPNVDGTPVNADIPCNIVGMPKIRNGKLEWLQVMRSNDLFLGTPHNIIQFTSLQEILAGWLGLALGTYVQVCDSLHVYEHDIERLSAKAPSPHVTSKDSLALPHSEFKEVLSHMGRCLDELRNPSLLLANLRATIKNENLPVGWNNLRLVVVADSARRRGWHDEASLALASCTNEVLHSAWDGWSERKKNRTTQS